MDFDPFLKEKICVVSPLFLQKGNKTLITMKKKLGKREVLRLLNEENNQLKRLIGELHQQIAAIEAQNAMIGKEISFFNQRNEEREN